MAIKRPSEKLNSVRLDQISKLKASLSDYNDLGRLKDSHGWPAMRKILDNIIKNQEFRIQARLSEKSFDDYNHSEAKTANEVKAVCQSLIDAVEKPDEPAAYVRDQIKAIQKQIEESKELEV